MGAGLDVFVVRKLGAPAQPELGIGALAEGDDALVDPAAARAVGADDAAVERLVARERREVDRQVALYREGRPLPRIVGLDVVVVDDGLATGVTAEAALRALRPLDPRTLTLAAPVCAPSSADRLRPLADHVACVLSPERFVAVGMWYRQFDQTSDLEVLALLDQARRPSSEEP